MARKQCSTKKKKFRKVINWDSNDVGSKFSFYCLSIFILPFIIIFFVLFGWLYGIILWHRKLKENIEYYQEVYWEELTK